MSVCEGDAEIRRDWLEGGSLSPPMAVIINQHWLRLEFPLLSASPQAHAERLAHWDDSNTDEHTVRAGLEMASWYSVWERQKHCLMDK